MEQDAKQKTKENGNKGSREREREKHTGNREGDMKRKKDRRTN